PLITCALGFLLFSCAAILFAFVRERADSTLKEPGDGSALLSLPELGTIRHMPKRGVLLTLPTGEEERTKALSRNRLGIRRSPSLKEQAFLVAESFRSIATSVLFSGPNGKNPHVIVVTSAGP